MGKDMYFATIACPYEDCEYELELKTNNVEGREYNTKKRFLTRHIEKTHNKCRKEAIKMVNDNDAEKKSSVIDLATKSSKELYTLLSLDTKSKSFNAYNFVNKLSGDTKQGLIKHYNNTLENPFPR